MVEPYSPILEYYPTEFECDANGKTASWETVVKIPFIDERDIFDALSAVDHAKDLEAVDRLRNFTDKISCHLSTEQAGRKGFAQA
eukprot:g11928.t1